MAERRVTAAAAVAAGANAGANAGAEAGADAAAAAATTGVRERGRDQLPQAGHAVACVPTRLPRFQLWVGRGKPTGADTAIIIIAAAAAFDPDRAGGVYRGGRRLQGNRVMARWAGALGNEGLIGAHARAYAGASPFFVICARLRPASSTFAV